NQLIGAQSEQAAQEILQVGLLGVRLDRLGHLPVAGTLGEYRVPTGTIEDDLVGAGKAGEVAVAELQRRRPEQLRQVLAQHDYRRRVVDDGEAVLAALAARVLGELADLDDVVLRRVAAQPQRDQGDRRVQPELFQVGGRIGGDAASPQPERLLENAVHGHRVGDVLGRFDNVPGVVLLDELQLDLAADVAQQRRDRVEIELQHAAIDKIEVRALEILHDAGVEH